MTWVIGTWTLIVVEIVLFHWTWDIGLGWRVFAMYTLLLSFSVILFWRWLIWCLDCIVRERRKCILFSILIDWWDLLWLMLAMERWLLAVDIWIFFWMSHCSLDRTIRRWHFLLLTVNLFTIGWTNIPTRWLRALTYQVIDNCRELVVELVVRIYWLSWMNRTDLIDGQLRLPTYGSISKC